LWIDLDHLIATGECPVGLALDTELCGALEMRKRRLGRDSDGRLVIRQGPRRIPLTAVSVTAADMDQLIFRSQLQRGVAIGHGPIKVASPPVYDGADTVRQRALGVEA